MSSDDVPFASLDAHALNKLRREAKDYHAEKAAVAAATRFAALKAAMGLFFDAFRNDEIDDAWFEKSLPLPFIGFVAWRLVVRPIETFRVKIQMDMGHVEINMLIEWLESQKWRVEVVRDEEVRLALELQVADD